MSSKHVITAGTDGTNGEVIGYADDLCHALVHIERLLGGREMQMRIHAVNRGNECFIYNFISRGKSMWVKTQREHRKSIESVRPFEDVEPHREDCVFH